METILKSTGKIEENSPLQQCKVSPNKGVDAPKGLNTISDTAIALQNSRLQEKIKKQARTHSLLVSIVVVFASSWFPLNLLNVVLDVFSFLEKNAMVRTFVFCQLFINNLSFYLVFIDI